MLHTGFRGGLDFSESVRGRGTGNPFVAGVFRRWASFAQAEAHSGGIVLFLNFCGGGKKN